MLASIGMERAVVPLRACRRAARHALATASGPQRLRPQPPYRSPPDILRSTRSCTPLARAAAVRAARAYGAAASAAYGGPEHDAAARLERRMDTAYVFTADLLADAYQFIVPCYQRVYEWEEEVTRLLCDIEANLDVEEPDVNKLEVRATPLDHCCCAARRWHQGLAHLSSRAPSLRRRLTTWACSR